MILGDGSYWLSRFRSLSDRLVPHIVTLVPACAKSLDNGLTEDGITRNLISKLTASRVVREFAVLEYHFEPFQLDDQGNSISTGQIDFIARPIGVWRRDVYVGYECKCLNVKTSTGIRSRATEYVDKGVCRFITERYSAGLPIGCMLGYIIDGKVAVANEKIRSVISSRVSRISMIGKPRLLSSDNSCIQFETIHDRVSSGKKINIRHILVSCI